MQTSRTQVFTDISELLTLSGVARKDGRRVEEADLGIIQDAVMAVKDGSVAWVGNRQDFAAGGAPSEFRSASSVSLGGQSVLPGFVECHTHSVFAGNRGEEFEWRLRGQSYQEISQKGGGILYTVRATREASEDQLRNLLQERMIRFLDQGVTTVEIKSGYGLDLPTEVKCLRVAKQMKGPQIVTTYLGPHSRSPDFKSLDSYLDYLIDEVMPTVKREGLADRADIYIEKGFYTVEQGKRYFEAARRLGFSLTAHVEQLSEFGGADLALEYGANSVDHVVFINSETQKRLAQSKSVAVLLPTADFYLNMEYPPARSLLDQGGCCALSTDFNPGTSPSQDIGFVGLLARVRMKMTLPEVISGFTYSAAKALGIENKGTLTLGSRADFSVLNRSWRELFYSVGDSAVDRVFVSGIEAKSLT